VYGLGEPEDPQGEPGLEREPDRHKDDCDNGVDRHGDQGEAEAVVDDLLDALELYGALKGDSRLILTEEAMEDELARVESEDNTEA